MLCAVSPHAHQILHWHSCHPLSVFHGIVHGGLHRINQRCEDAADARREEKLFLQRLQARGYPRQLLMQCAAARSARATRPPRVKTKKTGLFLKIPYHPTVNTPGLRKHLRDLQVFGVHAQVKLTLGRSMFVQGYARNHRHQPNS